MKCLKFQNSVVGPTPDNYATVQKNLKIGHNVTQIEAKNKEISPVAKKEVK
jgi:hypothetical protein